MLNSNYFSKRYFLLHNKALNLWLQCKFGISFGKKELIQTQQEYFINYIRFLNYREKYIQDSKKINIKNEDFTHIRLLEKKLLTPLNLLSFSKYINRK